jgi:UDP-4-amino-4,6-dideoxy-N-acetyl-beta-L-altrosamine transaminase
MSLKRIPYGRQWIGPEEIWAVNAVLRSDFLTQGPKVREFEEKLAAAVGVKYAVAVANGTAALHLAALALGLKPGEEVITTPISFLATSNAILYAGATPVFTDVDPETQCLDPKLIEGKITGKTKAIFVTDFAGHPADLRAIRKIANKHDLKIVEDAAHALGASYGKNSAGDCAHADLAIFSFHPVKHVTTGEGGAVMVRDGKLYERLCDLRTHGVTRHPEKLILKTEGSWYYEMQELGFNYRLTDLQAAIGLEQLKKLGRFIDRRRQIAAMYCRGFEGCPDLDLPAERPGNKHVYHLFVIRLKGDLSAKRKEVFEQLQRRGIGVQVHYIPIPAQPYYEKLGYRAEDYPQALSYYRRTISLPMFPKMTDREVKRVIRMVRETILRCAKGH